MLKLLMTYSYVHCLFNDVTHNAPGVCLAFFLETSSLMFRPLHALTAGVYTDKCSCFLFL